MASLETVSNIIWQLSVSILSVTHIMFAAAVLEESGLLKHTYHTGFGHSPSAMIDQVLVAMRPRPPPGELCPICHEEFTRAVKLECCQHIFCDFCIRTALTIRDTCPLDFKSPFKKARMSHTSTTASFQDVIFVSVINAILASFLALVHSYLASQDNCACKFIAGVAIVMERLCYAVQNALVGDHAMEVFVGESRFHFPVLKAIVLLLAILSMVADIWILRYAMAAYVAMWTVPSAMGFSLKNWPLLGALLRWRLRHEWRALRRIFVGRN